MLWGAAGGAAGGPDAWVKFCRGRYREGRPGPANFCWERASVAPQWGPVVPLTPFAAAGEPCGGRAGANPEVLCHPRQSGLRARRAMKDPETAGRGREIPKLAEARCGTLCVRVRACNWGGSTIDGPSKTWPWPDPMAFVSGAVVAGIRLREPKKPGEAGKGRVLIQIPAPYFAMARRLLVICLRHRCTRRPRAKHASHEAGLSQAKTMAAKGWRLWLLLASTRRHRRAGRSVSNRCRSHPLARCISVL